jgi:hypothetical protein
MNKDSKNFRDGRIEETIVTPDYIKARISCSAVESGELTVFISSNPKGWLNIHFSGLGDKTIGTVQTCANGVDIRIKI